MDLDEILVLFKPFMQFEELKITQLRHKEDNEPYQVWRIDTEREPLILKEAKGYEAEIYADVLSKINGNTPALYQTAMVKDKTYLLMQFVKGCDLCRCDRRKLVLALDALISVQKSTWESRVYEHCAYTFHKSVVDRKRRGEYLHDTELEAAYKRFLQVYVAVPRTFCHDDLLPFNIIASDDKAILIDWEYGGVLPYPTSFARFIAHYDDLDNALFYMTKEDREFSIDYYYDRLLKDFGISYADWCKTLEYFLFYEYCEWIFVGNKYGNTENNYYKKYFPMAKHQAQKILMDNPMK